MTFKNLRTGNLLSTENEAVIETMMASPNYEKVEEKVTKKK